MLLFLQQICGSHRPFLEYGLSNGGDGCPPSMDLDATMSVVLFAQEVSSDSKLIVSGGWDSRLCGWHTDQEKRQSSVPAFSTELPGKVFAMSKLGEWRYIIATSSRRILIFDIRKPSEPQEQR